MQKELLILGILLPQRSKKRVRAKNKREKDEIVHDGDVAEGLTDSKSTSG